MRHALAPLAVTAVAAAAIAAPSIARADGLSIVGQLNMSAAGTTGAIADEMKPKNVPILSAGLGIRTRHFGFQAVGDVMGLNPERPSLDGKDLLSWGGGFDLAAYAQLGAGHELYARAGYRWRTLSAGEEVQRNCNQTGDCAGGFWIEEPEYSTQGLSTAIGVQKTFGDRSTSGSIGLELRVERVAMDLPGRGRVGGSVVFFGLTGTIGSSGHRR